MARARHTLSERERKKKECQHKRNTIHELLESTVYFKVHLRSSYPYSSINLTVARLCTFFFSFVFKCCCVRSTNEIERERQSLSSEGDTQSVLYSLSLFYSSLYESCESRKNNVAVQKVHRCMYGGGDSASCMSLSLLHHRRERESTYRWMEQSSQREMKNGWIKITVQ